MTTLDEERWRRFVLDYNIDVPQSVIENELALIKLDLRHRMQYDRLSGGDSHLYAARELESQETELLEAATFEAKEPRVLRDLIDRLGIEVSQKELEEEALALAKREGTSLNAVKVFFGDDLAMLERDVREQKARDWALSNS